MTNNSDFLWYDLEAFGNNPWRDRISQFAAIRTDSNFNILEQHSFFCKPPIDRLPKPEACLVTGITPQYTAEHGIAENEFAKKVAAIFAKGNTCRTGYNSIRFDDEMCRSLFYRNFINPYNSEWQSGNSRWDLLDLVRLVYACYPDTLVWPKNAEGNVLFKLELLAKANNLTANIKDYVAHEALSDIKVTIELAKLIKSKQPRLFDYCLNNRKKDSIKKLLADFGDTPYLHISGRFPAKLACASLVATLFVHPKVPTQFIIADLRYDPKPWLDLNLEQLQQSLYGTREDLEANNLQRLPIKTINLSHCPIVATAKLVNAERAEHLAIDPEQCTANLQIWQSQSIQPLQQNILNLYSQDYKKSDNDVETDLYGKFIDNKDERQFQDIHNANFDNVVLADPRLQALLIRYKAQHFSDSLTNDQTITWQNYCKQNIIAGGDKLINIEQYRQQLKDIEQTPNIDTNIIEQLKDWGELLNGKLKIENEE